MSADDTTNPPSEGNVTARPPLHAVQRSERSLSRQQMADLLWAITTTPTGVRPTTGEMAAELVHQGRIEGTRSALVNVLTARGVTVSEAGHARVARCGDLADLTRWLTVAATATSDAFLFAAS